MSWKHFVVFKSDGMIVVALTVPPELVTEKMAALHVEGPVSPPLPHGQPLTKEQFSQFLVGLNRKGYQYRMELA